MSLQLVSTRNPDCLQSILFVSPWPHFVGDLNGRNTPDKSYGERSQPLEETRAARSGCSIEGLVVYLFMEF